MLTPVMLLFAMNKLVKMNDNNVDMNYVDALYVDKFFAL